MVVSFLIHLGTVISYPPFYLHANTQIRKRNIEMATDVPAVKRRKVLDKDECVRLRNNYIA